MRERSGSLPSQPGNWHLTSDVTLTEDWQAPFGVTNLCLNGRTIAFDNDHKIVIGGGIVLNIYDEPGDKGCITHLPGAKGCAVFIVSGGCFTLNGGSISGNNANEDGGVYVQAGIITMNGTGEKTFEPMTATTRAMIVTMLWRLEGSPVVNYQMSFKDVPDDEWYTEPIRWADSEGIVNGYDEENFGTNDSVTREQLATILYRSAQAKGKGFHDGWAFPLQFDDADQVSDWADEAMHWMVMTGVINGVSEKELSPKSDAVRAQVAAMLMRFEKSI